MHYAPKRAFYMFGSSVASKPVGLASRSINRLSHMLSPTRLAPNGIFRKTLTDILRWIDRQPLFAHLLERAEFAFKSPVYGCQACGNCVLPDMQYVCPQTCPKQLRNGPCGGTSDGQCEVIPEKPCIWVGVYERAKAAGELDSLKVYVPPPDRSLKGTSSWINFFLERDSRPRSGSATSKSVKDQIQPRSGVRV